MGADERLREAILELEVLRAREARTNETTSAILACIEAYSRAPNPDAALESLFVSLRNLLGADQSFLAHVSTGGPARVVASDTLSWIGKSFVAPFDLSVRLRNLADLHSAGRWEGQLDLTRFASALISPVADRKTSDYALVCLKRLPSFARRDQPILERLAGLFVRAVQAQALTAQNALLAATIQGSSSGFAIADATDPEHPLIYVNPAFEDITGYPPDEVLGRNCRLLSAETGLSQERTRLRQAVQDKERGQFLLRNRRKSGALFWNELTLYPVRSGDGSVSHLVATQTDVTQRIEAQTAQDRTRDLMEQAVAASEDAFLLLTPAGLVDYANAAIIDLFPAPGVDWRPGTRFSDNWEAFLTLMRRTEGRVTRLLAEADLDRLSQSAAGMELDLPDGRSVMARAHAMADGTLVLWGANVTAQKAARGLLEQRLEAIEASRDGIALVDTAGRLTFLNSAAARALGFDRAKAALGRKWQSRYIDAGTLNLAMEFEGTFVRRDPSERAQTHHEITGSPLAQGGAVLVLRDITDRLATEAREAGLRSALSQAQRREAMAELTAGVAHDFNNLLSAISGSAALISLDDSASDETHAHAARVSAAGLRAARLVNRLLDMGAGGEDDQLFDLGAALGDVPQLVTGSLPNTLEFSVALPEAPLTLRGSPDEVNQIVINLILNARDAMGHAPGRIALDVGVYHATGAETLAVGELRAGQAYARIQVTDTGPGMDPSTIDSAFDAYFTTKGRLGTGLGLAMVAGHARAAGGAVALVSELGQGAEITVFWPVTEPGQEHVQTGSSSGSFDLSGLILIVVDDEPDVAQVLQSYLERQGAEVAVVSDPDVVIEAVREDPQAWSAVVTDYDMPKMNGGELVERLSQISDLPVFVVTALARRLTDPRVGPGKVAGIFAKPVDLSQLGGALADLRPEPPIREAP